MIVRISNQMRYKLTKLVQSIQPYDDNARHQDKIDDRLPRFTDFLFFRNSIRLKTSETIF